MDSQTVRACALLGACVALHRREQLDTGSFLSTARSFEQFVTHGVLNDKGQGVAQVGLDGLSVQVRGPRATPALVEQLRKAVAAVVS